MNPIKNSLPPFLLVAGLLLAAGCGGNDAPEAEGQAPAQPQENVLVLGERDVARVTEGVIEEGIAVTGNLDPFLRVDVKAQIGGTLQQVRFEEGQPVREGTVMATVDAQGIRSQATSAQAGVAAAEANLALARRQYESARTLHEAGAMSDIAFEQAKTAYESAQAQVTAAKSQATGASEQASRTVIRAPISGVVSSRTAESGEAVNPGQTLYTLVSTQQLELAGQIPVTSARFVKVGQPVVFTLDAYPGQTFRGAVARMDPTADPQSRQLRVYLRMPNPGGIVGGVFATGRIVSSEVPSSPLVPTAAVRTEGATQYVFALQNEQVVKKPVTVTARDDARGLAAVSGVQPGEVVLVAPGTAATEGAKVRLADTQAAAPTASPATEE